MFGYLLKLPVCWIMLNIVILLKGISLINVLFFMSQKNSVIGKARLSNNVNLNPFDLSCRRVFTSSLGNILPCTIEECLPNEKISHNPSWVTRAQSLTSDSFGRLVENVQSFFVPIQTLWRFASQTMLSTTAQNVNGQTESRSSLDPLQSAAKGTTLPYICLSDMYRYLYFIEDYIYYMCSFEKDDFTMHSSVIGLDGMLRSISSARLFSYLGYGSFDEILDPNNRDFDKHVSISVVDEEDSTKIIRTIDIYPLKSSALNQLKTKTANLTHCNVALPIFRLLAYQKCYNDFYRLDTWMPYRAQSCNIDYVLPSNPYVLDSKYTGIDFTDLFDDAIDLLDGAEDLPTLQSAMNQAVNFIRSFVPFLDNPYACTSYFDLRQSNLELDYVNGVLPSPQYGPAAVVNVDTTSQAYGKFSVSAFRSAVALQKFKEIAASNDSSYSKQILAHFGVEPTNDPYKTYFVGGNSVAMQIDTQVNTNLVDSQAIRGGIGSASGEYSCNYHTDTYGIFITLYRMYPLVDYSPSHISDKVAITDVDSLPIPEMDSVGMEARRFYNVVGFDGLLSDYTVYGYAARYFDYKVGIDQYFGDICYTLSNKILASNSLIGTVNKDTLLRNFQYLLVVQPFMVDNVFLNTRHSLLSDDQFYTNFSNGISMLRPLSVHGLPFAN